jgi:predicted XRE-type DNA-binding protein
MDEIKRQGLTQKEAADVMEIKQPDVSRILRGDFNWLWAGTPLKACSKARPRRGN